MSSKECRCCRSQMSVSGVEERGETCSDVSDARLKRAHKERGLFIRTQRERGVDS
jgi:hypothetical protein